MNLERDAQALSLLFATQVVKELLALVPVLSQSFFTLVRRHLMSFLLFTTWHNGQF